MKQFSIWLWCATLTLTTVHAQWVPTTQPETQTAAAYWLTGLTLHPEKNVSLPNHALLIREGKFMAIQPGLPAPDGLPSIALDGFHAYPSFIHLADGIPAAPKSRQNQGPVYEGKRDPYRFHWNDAVRPEEKATAHWTSKEQKDMLSAGFGLGVVQKADGVFRGTACFVTYADVARQTSILIPEVAAAMSLKKGSSVMAYPSSETGTIALIRQVMLDADWYARIGKNQQVNLVYEAILAQKKWPWLLDAGGKWALLRLSQLAKSWNVQMIVLGHGDEYQQLKAIKSSGAKLVLPLDFPEAYDLSHPLSSEKVDLTQLMHWEMAPSNPAQCLAAGIPTALACTKKPEDFLSALRKAAFAGADTSELLQALTRTPAEWLGIEKKYGRIAKGMEAFAFITQAPLFGKEEPVVLAHVASGQWKPLAAWGQTLSRKPIDLRGKWRLQSAQWPGFQPKKLVLKGSLLAPSGTFFWTDTTKFSIKPVWQQASVHFQFFAPIFPGTVQFQLHAKDTHLLVGTATTPKGELFPVTMEKTGPWIPEGWDTTKDDRILGNPFLGVAKAPTPFHPFGFYPDSLPVASSVFIQQATVWTGEKEGILPKADVWFADGKIKAVAPKLDVPKGATVISGEGLHLTAGIIDEHAHIALRNGVNEGGQSVTSEVRMADVVHPDDVHIYQQLSGGVTSAHLLHGSANPIGGQTVMIKLRWGLTAEEMIFSDAPGFIKFALGENVKQSNWGENFTTRYPQTRMGVESTMRDAFLRAKAYKATMNTPDFRRDLELDALVEILDGKRHITCHSYVRSEILMLMQLADSLGFKINTFTHILEGYKVTEEMAKHGAAGSTFSDWWAYKMEVRDAIPYNASMLYRAGVATALNSDDASMGRRLNQEAAKAVKYGGVPEEHAWNMVTINPAKMLHIDHRVGSIRVGKDADLVLWSGHPMSMGSRVKMTWVDGVLRYSQSRNQQLVTAAQLEKRRLVQKTLDLAARGEKTQPIRIKKMQHYHCESIHHADDLE